jgi:Holliday junction DNA helicase RuvA
MIAYLSGKIVLNRTGYIILDTGGVGYKIFVSNTDVADSESASLFVYEHIREDSDDLFGFKDYENLGMFIKLISVNGVGPKVAMTIMTVTSSERIVEAIISENIAFFQAIPGIGKKVAAKIILELKSKISSLEGSGVIGRMDEGDEVVDALMSLGYKKGEAEKMLSKIPADVKTSEDRIRWCLRNISK